MEEASFGLSVNDEKVIDLKNMWLPWSAGGKIHLAANTSLQSERGIEEAALNSLCVLHQTQWLFDLKWARRLIITSSMVRSQAR